MPRRALSSLVVLSAGLAALGSACARDRSALPVDGGAALARPGPEAERGSAASEGRVARPILSFEYLSWPGMLHGDGKTEVLDDPHWAHLPDATVEPDDTFLLELGIGSGLHGLNLTVIPRSGRCYQTFDDDGRGSWRVVDFQIGDAEVRQLVQVLNDNRFLQLAMSYAAVEVHDGTQWVIHVRTGGRDKFVALGNSFPPPVVAVARFVAERIVDARPELRGMSRPTRLGVAHADHLWREKRRYAPAASPVDTSGLPANWDAPRLDVLAIPEGPEAPSARFLALLVDRSASDRVVARELSEQPRLWLRYDAEVIDLRHRYAVRVQMGEGGQVTAAGEDLPVLTFGAPHALEVPLRGPRPAE